MRGCRVVVAVIMAIMVHGIQQAQAVVQAWKGIEVCDIRRLREAGGERRTSKGLC